VVPPPPVVGWRGRSRYLLAAALPLPDEVAATFVLDGPPSDHGGFRLCSLILGDQPEYLSVVHKAIVRYYDARVNPIRQG